MQVGRPTVFYSFSWDPFFTAPSLFPDGRTMVAYLHRVAAKNGIQDKVQLNTDIEECVWSETEQLWTVTLVHLAPGMGDLSAKDRAARVAAHGADAVVLRRETVKAKVLVSCVGALVEPKAMPDYIPGSQDFKGDIFHAARWNHAVDLTDKNVVVIGTGSSAIQIVPSILKPPYNVKSVTQLMKTPPWVVPKSKEPGGKEAFAKTGPTVFKYAPFLGWMLREFTAYNGEKEWFLRFADWKYSDYFRTQAEQQQLARMKRHAPAKYHDILTPNFRIGCKRRIFDNYWYRSLNNDKVRLTTKKITRITRTGIVLGPEKHYPPNAPADAAEEEVAADIIVLANGYETTTWLHPLILRGKGGREIHDVWTERGGPQAYLSTAMDGFPNAFMIIGPNSITGTSSIILQTENMVLHTLQMIKPLLQGDARVVEVKESAQRAYTARIQRDLKQTVFHTGGCGSWYVDPKTKWNPNTYP